MKLKIFDCSLLLALLALVWFRPWKHANEAIGLEPPAETAVESQDSLLLQPISIVLPQTAVDTITERMLKRDSVKIALLKRSKATDAQIAQCRKEIADKQTLLQQMQQEIVSIDDILSLTERQRKGDGKGFP